MRAIVKDAPTVGVQLMEVPLPTIEPDEVLIEVGAASICGADRHLYDWSPMIQALEPTLPLIPGHETAGTIVEVGAAVTKVAVGQRVAVESHLYCGRCFPCTTGNAHLCEQMRILGIHWNGAFAERMKVPESVCFPLPDGISLEVGALLEPVGVAVHATQRAGALAGASVCVCGCGPLGLFIIQLALLSGAVNVVALELDGFRRKLAEQLGAIAIDPRESSAVDLCRKLTGRRAGVDVSFEASGAKGVLPTLFELTRPAGTVVTVGHPGTVEIDVSAAINFKYVTLKGIFGRRLWDTWETMLELVAADRLDLDAVITHRLGLDEFDRSMELLNSGAGKVIFTP